MHRKKTLLRSVRKKKTLPRSMRKKKSLLRSMRKKKTMPKDLLPAPAAAQDIVRIVQWQGKTRPIALEDDYKNVRVAADRRVDRLDNESQKTYREIAVEPKAYIRRLVDFRGKEYLRRPPEKRLKCQHPR